MYCDRSGAAWFLSSVYTNDNSVATAVTACFAIMVALRGLAAARKDHGSGIVSAASFPKAGKNEAALRGTSIPRTTPSSKLLRNRDRLSRGPPFRGRPTGPHTELSCTRHEVCNVLLPFSLPSWEEGDEKKNSLASPVSGVYTVDAAEHATECRLALGGTKGENYAHT
ncbi:hypothetical protein MRX96_055877 [Rhipicephalus microplus]